LIKFSFKLTLIVSRKIGFDESRQTSSPSYSNCSEKRRLTFDGKNYSYSVLYYSEACYVLYLTHPPVCDYFHRLFTKQNSTEQKQTQYQNKATLTNGLTMSCCCYNTKSVFLFVSRKIGFDVSRQISSPCYSNCSEKRRLTFDGKNYSYSHNHTVPLRMCWTFFFSVIICLVTSPSAILGDFFHLHAQLIFCWKEQI
jgi:hypothetical protein